MEAMPRHTREQADKWNRNVGRQRLTQDLAQIITGLTMPGRAQLTDQQNNPHGGERSERVAAQPCLVSADRKCRPSVTDSDNRISTGTSLRLHTDHYRRLFVLQSLTRGQCRGHPFFICKTTSGYSLESRDNSYKYSRLFITDNDTAGGQVCFQMQTQPRRLNNYFVVHRSSTTFM
ncbi:hypothetical protein J6590_073135 [Homalodisca vitripennis]|nr:hypothetical protein J6590_073135 [Homalodisca vitripennis]